MVNPESEQNKAPLQEVQKTGERIKGDLLDLFRSAENPIAILLQTMETDEFKSSVSDEIAHPIKAELQALTFEDEDDFVAKVIAVAMPVLEINKHWKKIQINEKYLRCLPKLTWRQRSQWSKRMALKKL